MPFSATRPARTSLLERQLWSTPQIIPRSCRPKLSNMIIQKELAFDRHWSGTGVTSGRAQGAQRSCPAGSMAEVGLRWCGGRRDKPNGGSRVRISEEAISRVTGKACCFPNVLGREWSRLTGQERRCRVQASSPYSDASVAIRRHDFCDDGRHRLATAFGARLSCRRCAQAPQTEAQFEEG